MGTSSQEGENSKNEEDVKQLVVNHLSFFKVVWNDRYLLVNCW